MNNGMHFIKLHEIFRNIKMVNSFVKLEKDFDENVRMNVL